jgi:hypothetical protein
MVSTDTQFMAGGGIGPFIHGFFSACFSFFPFISHIPLQAVTPYASSLSGVISASTLRGEKRGI